MLFAKASVLPVSNGTDNGESFSNFLFIVTFISQEIGIIKAYNKNLSFPSLAALDQVVVGLIQQIPHLCWTQIKWQKIKREFSSDIFWQAVY
jgi:hypothetical protein